MTNYFIKDGIVGTEASKPDPADPTGNAQAPNYPLFIAGDTGKIYQSTGAAWVHVDDLGGSSLTGVTTDAQGNMSVAGSQSVGVPPATLETDIAGDLFADPPNFHIPTIWTQTLTAEPGGGIELGYATTPDSLVTLKGMPAGAPSFNDYFYAQKFVAAATIDVVRVQLRVRLAPTFPIADASKIGLSVALAPDSSDVPGGATGSPVSVRGSQLSSDRFVLASFSFEASPFSLTSGGSYWLQLYVSTADIGYPATFQIEANATAAPAAVETLDEEATWTPVAGQGTIAANLNSTSLISVTDPMQFGKMIGENGATPPASPVSITGTLTGATLAQLTSIVSELLVALDAKGTITKSTT